MRATSTATDLAGASDRYLRTVGGYMRRPRFLAVALAIAMAAFGPSTAAYGGPDDPSDDHPGTYIPSPEGSSKNMHLLASAPRTGTGAANPYRNSDLAFWGRTAFAGNYEGFRTIDISDPENPKVLSDFACVGSQ